MAESDKLLKDLEGEIQEIYARAAEEMQEKCDRYLERFAAKDKMMLERLTAGDITQSEYYKWRTGQMLTGNRYKTMVNDLATDMTNANKLARSMTIGYMPEVYALSANEQAYEIEKALKIDTSYTLYNRQTVERLISREPKVLPGARPGSKTAQLLAERKDLRWNKQKINSELTQGILQGEPIPKIAKRMRNVTDMNQASSIRNARTMTTSAQSGGQLDSLYRARDLGINVKKGWMAALDNRTRHEHAILDGQVKELDEPFEVSGKKIMFPGDPNAAPELVYNCRCRIIGQYDGQQSIRDMPRDSKLGDMSYDEWKKGHAEYLSSELEKPAGQQIPQIKAMTRDEYLAWQKANSTHSQLDKQFQEKYGKTLEEAERDRTWVDGEFLDDIAERVTDDLWQVGPGYGHCGYIQSSDGSKAINTYLREGKVGMYSKKEMQETIDAMNRLIDATELPQDMLVDRCAGIDALRFMGVDIGDVGTKYRINHAYCTDGVNFAKIASDINSNYVGSILVDRGFMSASVDPGSNVFGGSDVTFTILAEQGRHAFISDNLAESEVVFAPGSQQMITGARVVEREVTDWDGTKIKRETLEIFLKFVK